MTAGRLALVLSDGLLVVLFVARLVALKRAINRYRPPSPLPRYAGVDYTLTITRVS